MRNKIIRMKNVFAIAFLIASLFLFVFQVFSVAPGANCKDCGDVSNCIEGNGLDSGYSECEVVWDFNGNAVGCIISGWGCGSAS